MSSLKKLAILGTIWTILGYGGSQVVRLISNLILTRLLFPEFFGLMAIVNVFITGLILFSDIGINLSIIQNKRGDQPEFYNTAWTIQVIRGFGLWIAACVLAVPVASLYDIPELRFLIPAVGFASVISGFNSTSLAILDRNLEIKKRTIIDMVCQILGTLAIVIWASIYPSVWALVAGNFVATTINCVWSHFLFPDRNKFAWNKEVINEILSVGQWVFISTALTFTAEQADRLLLGKLFPLGLFGIYQIAISLSDFPRGIVQTLGGKVLFPVMTKVIDQPIETVTRTFLKNRRILVMSFILFVSSMVSCGDLMINFLYDDRYEAAQWMFPILTLGVWPRLLAHTGEPFLFAKGLFNYTAFGNFARLLFTVIGVLVGFKYLGVFGAIIAVSLNDLFYYLLITYGMIREKLNPLSQDITATLMLLLVSGLVILGRIVLGLGHPLSTLTVLDITP
jgi:O-antigen/teichoic acid export membrane protein